jgi:phosphoribosylanthranilate isomerase
MSFLEPGDAVRIKICGVTSRVDAEAALSAGADALGFNFYRGSKRHVAFEENRSWIKGLAGRAFRVAVVVDAEMDELRALRSSECFEAVQFHGDETPRFCANAGFSVWIRAVRVKDDRSLKDALRYETRYLLLDAWAKASYGGTGRQVNRNLAREFVAAQPERRIILAGGLSPENVAEAVATLRPHAVDVASGVETGPGRKDPRRMADFIAAARSALERARTGASTAPDSLV